MNKLIDFSHFVEFGDVDIDGTPYIGSDSQFGGIPRHTRQALYDYFIHRYEPGSFLMGVLTNDLYRAANSADAENATKIKAIVKWLLCAAPAGSYGSVETVKDWLEGGAAYQDFMKRATWAAISQ
ncbi:MAG: hypothetical protein N2235_05145 [Fischerella sp.]|nr:hypothetical protein [Fischerella sp.]